MLPAGMDLAEMAGPLLGMARQMGSAMFAMQAGQGLGHLSQRGGRRHAISGSP